MGVDFRFMRMRIGFKGKFYMVKKKLFTKNIETDIIISCRQEKD